MQESDSLGLVVAVPTLENPKFEIEIDGRRGMYSRAQLRLVRDESQDKYREDLGYGRGQRERREVSREKLVRLSVVASARLLSVRWWSTRRSVPACNMLWSSLVPCQLWRRRCVVVRVSWGVELVEN